MNIHRSNDQKLSRSDFLRLLVATGGSLFFSPFLKACSNIEVPASTLTPTSSISTLTMTSLTEDELLAGLQGLDIDSFLYEAYKRWMLRDPEGITLVGLSDFYGVGNDRLTDISEEFLRETQRLQSGVLQLLRQYDTALFNPDQVLNSRLYDWFLDDQVRSIPFMYSDYLVTPFVNSLPWNMNYLFTEAQPENSIQDVQDTIDRLGQVKAKFFQVIDGLKHRQENGVILPAFLIPNTIQDLKQYTVQPLSHPFYRAFSIKLANISEIKEQDIPNWLLKAENAINGSVIPAYQMLMDHLNQVIPIAPEEIGVWRFPNGAQYYEHILRHYTTTDLSPEEIHQLGIENVERIQTEMRKEFGKLGYPMNESIKSLVERLGQDDGYISGIEVEDLINSSIDQSIGMLDQAFEFPLETEIKVVGGEQGNYFSAAPRDASRPPVFYASSAFLQPKFPLKSIAFHETVPGHGYQFDVANQLNLPLHRDAFQYDGYVEGWALYAERLMWELGAYDGNPAGNIGRLDLELLRAVRCVLDTGIHFKRWTYPQARQYMLDARGVPGDNEIGRYIMWPAQAVSYYIGFQKILELRQKARDALGSVFDLKKFHSVILGSGQVPLSILEEQINAYIGITG